MDSSFLSNTQFEKLATVIVELFYLSRVDRHEKKTLNSYTVIYGDVRRYEGHTLYHTKMDVMTFINCP